MRTTSSISPGTGVEPWEAEEAATEPDRASIPARGGRTGIVGRTWAGRMLVVIIERKEAGLVRVVTARDATEREKRIYRRQKR